MKRINLHRIKSVTLLGLTLLFFHTVQANIFTTAPIEIKKDLLYDQHTLNDSYPYKKGTRQFQWDKIKTSLALIESLRAENANWGILQNNKDRNGRPPLVENYHTDEYGKAVDAFDVPQHQAIPLYNPTHLTLPERYGRDGSLVKIIATEGDFIRVEHAYFPGEWLVPQKYVNAIQDNIFFNKAVFVDRTNQNITTLEKVDNQWLVRSMNPATTGLHKPPYRMETPLGIFVVQDKLDRMVYYQDGTTDIGGFAPYASRFSQGAYLHGIPVNLPDTEMVEISPTLGTTPRSHMCVRNATSHAQFLYGWAGKRQALVLVFD